MMKMQIEDYAAIVSRMRNRALSSEYRGTLVGTDLDYFRRCRVRIGNATLIFTRNNHDAAPEVIEAAMAPRCWHLSISGFDDVERDAWLRAFFGADLDRVWAESFGTNCMGASVTHWRLPCDATWSVISVSPEAAGLLRADGWRRAGELVDTSKQRRAA